MHRTTSYQARKAKLGSVTLQMRELRFGEAQQPDKYTTKSCHLPDAVECQALHQPLCPRISHKHPTRG